MEAESKSRRLESKAREAVERAVSAKEERDVACHEVAMARLEIKAVGSARAQMESELALVQHALAASEKAQRKVESEFEGFSSLWILLERPGGRRRRKLVV